MSEVEVLKVALRCAILNTRRTKTKIIKSDPAGSAYEIDWTDDTKKWAKLCDLDLETHDPFHFSG